MKSTRSRPRIFRALGDQQPPDEIQIQENFFLHQKTIKHDSWAATALYLNPDSGRKVICKFNRKQSVFGFPMGWLGRLLARRENKMYERLADLPNVAEGFSEVMADEQRMRNAAAHEYIEGHPLRWYDNVDDSFFDKLESTLKELHSRSIAYVDMNKSENVIVDQNGNPCLIDFQISVRWPKIWPVSWALRMLQHSDLYHCEKLKLRFRPDLVPEGKQSKPWWIRLHRKIANPFRAFRRGLLVKLGIRKGKGKPQTEAFIEEGLRQTSAVDAKTQDAAESNKNVEHPILALYDLLISPSYIQTFDGNDEYSEQMFFDLAGQPESQSDFFLIKHLKRVPPFCKAIDLLRHRRVFVESERWSESWIQSKILTLQQRIAGSQHTPSQKKVA